MTRTTRSPFPSLALVLATASAGFAQSDRGAPEDPTHSAITPLQRVTLARDPGSPTRGFASVEFDGERVEVSYELGEQRHTLASYELDFATRWVLRRDQRRLEHGWKPADPEPAEHLADENEAWTLRLVGPAQTQSYSARGLRNLPPGKQGPAAHLRRHLDAHPVHERTVLGRVVEGRVVSDDLTLIAQAPLDALLAELEGELVLVEAALEEDAATGAVLYLIAAAGETILPVEAPGPDAGMLWAMPCGIHPPDLGHVPSAQDGDREWPRRLAELTWSQAEADALLAPRVDGMLDALDH